MAPFSAEYLGAVAPDQIAASVAEAGTPAQAGDAPLGDYVLMYGALAGDEARAHAWAAAQSLPDSAMDDGDSRTYLLAYLAALGS